MTEYPTPKEISMSKTTELNELHQLIGHLHAVRVSTAGDVR